MACPLVLSRQDKLLPTSKCMWCVISIFYIFTSIQNHKCISYRYTLDKYPVKASDVIIASGASGALAMVLPTLCNRGDNILLPRPGFSLYTTICEAYGIECRYG